MSRIGKKPVTLPDGVTASVDNGSVTVKGPKGELFARVHPLVTAKVEDGAIVMTVKNPDDIQQKTQWGTCGSLVANMVKGVTEGFEKKLELNGVGFRWAVSGKNLKMSLGFSHEVNYELAEGIEGSVEKNTLTITGIDKQKVGQVAAEIRAFKKPEPYKGKGIKYSDEHIRRKQGKQVTGGAA